jgi:hypothetical protein
MADHNDESLLDKVKNALGMGDDRDATEGHHATEGHDAHASTATDASDAEALDGDRAEGWAGVPEALYDDTSASTDRPAVAHGEEIVGGEYDTADGYGTSDEPSGLGRNPGPVGSAQYEDGATPADLGGADVDAEGNPDFTREEVASTQFGGAYGSDDTAMPTSAAWDRGEAPPEGEAGFESDETLDPGRNRGI